MKSLNVYLIQIESRLLKCSIYEYNLNNFMCSIKEI